MLNAFVDDSGSGGDSHFFVLSGLLSTVEQWARFSVDWKRLLDAPPSIAYFKMQEAEGLDGQFEGMAPAQRDAKVDALARLVADPAYVNYNISHLILQDDFETILYPVLPKRFRNPYLWAFNGMVSGLATYQDLVGPEKIECIFDKSEKKLERRAGWLFDRLRGRLGFESSYLIRRPIRFEDDKECLPLQGADLLAWHKRRHHSIPSEPERKIHKMLTSPPTMSYKFEVPRELLERIAQRFRRG